MVLKYYNVKVNIIDGKMPNSDYKKIPVIVIHDKQINDSFIIIKSLARILNGISLTPELLALEELATYGLMVIFIV